MAKAWIIPPLPVASWIGRSGLIAGSLEHLGNDYAGVVCRLASDAASDEDPAGYVNLDFGADRTFDTVMLFGVEGVPGNARVVITYALEAAGPFLGDVTAWDAGLVWAGAELPASGKVTGLLASPAPIVARYVQIALFTGSRNVVSTLSRVVLGKRIELERNFSFGATFGVKDLGSLDFNRRGVLQRTRGKKMRTVGLTFSNIRKDEVEAQTGPLLERIGNTEMVALVTDPAPDPRRQSRCYFGPLVGDLGHSWRKANAFEAKTNLVSIF